MKWERGKRMKTIRAKIVTLLIVCTILSSAICGGLSLVGVMDVANENAGEIMSMECKNTTQEIDSVLVRVGQSVDTLAELAEQSLTDLDKFKTDKEYVEEYTEQLRPAALEFARNTEGALTYYIRYNPEFTEPTSGIFASRESADADFEQLTPTDFSIYEEDDVAHVGWYYIPVQNGEATWMDPYLNSNINVYMISYVVPIYVDGVSVGVVGMDIDFSNIENMAESVQIYETGGAYIVNSANQIMYHKDLEFGTNVADVNNGELKALADGLADESKVGEQLVYTYNGAKHIGYYNQLENGMKLALTVSKSEVWASLNIMGWMIALAAVIAVAVSAIAGFFLSTGLVSPIKDATNMIRHISELNLTQNEKMHKLSQRKDEIGAMSKAVQEMNVKLSDMVQKLDETGTVILGNAEQLHTSSRSVGDMCSDNSATTQQLAAAMEESSATVENVSQNIETINQNAKDIMQLSIDGEEDSKDILNRAKNLSNTTMEATERTKAMYQQVREETEQAIEKSKAVEKINELTHTIMEISSQTNLLALNASIEAARAGESGRGFAVVADEIGNLASQTQNTINDIDSIIKEVYEAVEHMADCLNSSTEFLEKTVLSDYNDFMQVSEQYAADAGNVETNMHEIGEAVRILGAAIEEITEAINGISHMTEESAEGIAVIAEKTAEIVQKMSAEEEMIVVNQEKAVTLEEIVGAFTVE